MKVPGTDGALRLLNHLPKDMSTDDVLHELAPSSSPFRCHGISADPPPIQIGGQLTNSPYQYTLQGTDTQGTLPPV